MHSTASHNLSFLFITGLLLFLSSLPSHATSVTTANYPAQCSITPLIADPTPLRIPPDLDIEEIKQAVIRALGPSSSNPNLYVTMIRGQWFIEEIIGNTIFVGLDIRSHHLSVAIIIENQQLTAALCNSNNLKQTPTFIHRKA